MADRWARDEIASGDFVHADVNDAFARGGVIPEAIPGMVFIFQYFSGLPYVREAVTEGRSVDASLTDLADTADRLDRAYAAGTPPAAAIDAERAHIAALNSYIEPRGQAFSPA